MKPPITVLEELQSDWTHGFSSPTNRINALTNFADNQLQNIILDWYAERLAFENKIALLEAELKLDEYSQPELNHELQLALEIAS